MRKPMCPPPLPPGILGGLGSDRTPRRGRRANAAAWLQHGLGLWLGRRHAEQRQRWWGEPRGRPRQRGPGAS